jgi:hypothetical protein
MKLVLILPFLAVVMFAGCAEYMEVGRPIAWQEAPDPSRFDQETFDCARDAKTMMPGTLPGVFGGPIDALIWKRDAVASLTAPQRRLYIQCMEAKGYRRAER